jgi:hypothetical protein
MSLSYMPFRGIRTIRYDDIFDTMLIYNYINQQHY